MTFVIPKIEVRRQNKPRKGQIANEGHRPTLEEAERTRQNLADQNLFMGWAVRWVSTPRTVVVSKGGNLPTLHIKYPVVVKPARGPSFIKCQTHSAMLAAVRSMKGAYQVQECLTGFTFLRLYCEAGIVEVFKQSLVADRLTETPVLTDNHESKIARGVSRRLVDMIGRLGVKSFTLTVAVRQETAYVVSCRPDSGQLSH
jgi:hypothetical protein